MCTNKHNKNFEPTANAWHFWFAVILMFKEACGSFCIALLTS
ncbi:MAG: DUF3265 domain-containing protein [Vibrionaceae bacterium]|nr:DUF3265 domain-containing protein [Vibrionaceae bacterium]